jgi:hypothetical protein
MANETTIHLRRHRGMILQFVRNNHYSQMPLMDDLAVWALLLDLGCTVGQDYVVTLIQELKSAGYLAFKENFNRVSGKTRLEEIKLTPDGRRLVEGYREDPMVLIP